MSETTCRVFQTYLKFVLTVPSLIFSHRSSTQKPNFKMILSKIEEDFVKTIFKPLRNTLRVILSLSVFFLKLLRSFLKKILNLKFPA